MSKRLFVLGSINTDLVINTPYIPQQGETLMGSGFFTAHGGKGANQAVAASRSEASVLMCGAVGDDEFGRLAKQSLVDEGIDCKYVKTIDNCSSGVAVIIVNDGDNRIILDPGANYSVSKEDVDAFLNNSESGDIFLTQLELPIDVVSYALKRAKEKGLYVVLNPAPCHKEIVSSLKYVDLLIPNETECAQLGGIDKLKRDDLTIIVTLGSKGYRIINRSMDETYPCLKVKAIDTTAAGDTFIGALLAMLLEGTSLVDAAKYASKAASIACTRKGAQPSIPYKRELRK